MKKRHEYIRGLPAEVRELYPFRENYFKTKNERTMHYVDEGKGEAIIMVHGNPTWSFYYRNLVKGLSNRYRCIVPDHVGCGLSEKTKKFSYKLEDHVENLVQLVEHLNLKKFHLIVHDWGGPIGLGMSQRFPERLEKIVVLNTSAFLSKRIPLRILMFKVPILRKVLKTFGAFERVATMMASKKRLNPETRRGYLFPYCGKGSNLAVYKFVKDIPFGMQHPSYKTVQRIEENLNVFKNRPIMLCWGGKDFCFNDHYYSQWKKRFPDVEAHYFEDAGHYVLEDAGVEILERVKKFITD